MANGERSDLGHKIREGKRETIRSSAFSFGHLLIGILASRALFR